MNVFRQVFFGLFFLVFTHASHAQDLRENEIVVIHGEKFVLHQVRTGETIFSISRDFKISKQELMADNPNIENGLSIGEILKIPYKDGADLTEKPIFKKGDPTHFDHHTIRSRNETPYFIAKEYGITVEELYAYNPEVRRYKRGTDLRIPRWDVPAELKNIDANVLADKIEDGKLLAKMVEHTVQSGETLYSISKRYGIPESEIIFNNPGAKNLKAGSKLYLPGVLEEKDPGQNAEKDMVPGNANFAVHVIESGETMWSLTHKYKITEEELKAWNPVLKTAFPAGTSIKIPVGEIQQTQAIPTNEEAFENHLVQRGETIYALSVKYGIAVPEIIKYNPVLESRNLVAGETILIPKKIETAQISAEGETLQAPLEIPDSFYEVEMEMEVPESCVPVNNVSLMRKNYDVALFLPLFFEANDTLNRELLLPEISDSLMIDAEILADTLIEKEKTVEEFKAFFQNSENFLEFYEGVLIAVDSMQKAGMKINLKVFDTQSDAGSIRDYIYDSDFLETDLIIGPVYPQVQNEVAQIAAKNRIPMVSPFAPRSNIIDSNPYYFQINPTHEYIANETAEMVAEEYYRSNFVVLRTSAYENTPQGKLVELIREKLYNSGYLNTMDGGSFTVYDFKNEGSFGMRRLLRKGVENVVFIPSSVEGEVSVAVSNLNNLADDYQITLIGSGNYQQHYPSIELEHFHNLKLKYIYPYWIDFNNDASINFIKQFKQNFYTEPGNFGVQGFDVAFYFLNALNYFGRDFEDCLPYFHINLVQGNYHFEKVSQFGGYMNKGVSVISYTRDYEVLRKRVKGQPRLVAKF